MDPRSCRVNFCKDCGTLLDTPDEDSIVCLCCGSICGYGDLAVGNLEIETFSVAKPAPSWASSEIVMSDRTKQRATVQETCQDCGHDTASFYTMQLRSVDEGQTVFYECLKCSSKWSQNN